MVLGLLADPRAHLLALSLGVGSLLFLPELAEVTGQFETQAAETIDRVWHDAYLAFAIGDEPAA